MNRPALAKSLEFIMKTADARGLGKGGVLPGVRDLARECGVARATMFRALALCKSRGLVSGTQGGRLRVAESLASWPSVVGSCSISLHESNAVPLWNRIQTQIRRDVLSGVHGPGTSLGSLKTLGHRYGVSYCALKRALESLVAEGLLDVRRKTYCTKRFAGSAGSSTIVLIGAANSQGAFTFQDHSMALLRLVEQECSRRGIRLRSEVYFREETTAQQKAFSVPIHDGILGYVFVVSGYQGEEERGRRYQVLRDLSRLRKPAAIVETREPLDMTTVPEAAHVQFFNIGMSRRPAEIVGRFLLELGHTRICFFSMHHGEIWSRNRLDGLSSVYTAAGLDGAVIPLVVPDSGAFPGSPEQQAALRKWQTVVSAFDRWRRSVPPAYGKVLDSLVRRDIPGSRIPAVAAMTGLRGLFQQGLAHSEVTAWVGVNDVVAVEALRFLRDRGVSVPQRISVVGLDDTAAALDAGLTSYNFNPSALQSLIMNHVTWPRRAGARFPHEADGFIVERGSTAMTLPR